MRRRISSLAELRIVREVRRPGSPDRWVHPEWAARHSWIVQGVTSREPPGRTSDFALFAEGSRQDARSLWMSLAETLGFSGIHHARQVHGRDVLVHAAPVGQGLQVGPDADGHATGTPGVLMGVTVADCVPIYLVDPVREAVALLHAGWRGVAGGVLEMGLEIMGGRFGSQAEDLLCHLGPSICGACYEVGPEVHRALGQPDPGKPAPVDLRGLLAARAIVAGMDSVNITRSAYCTLCGEAPLFSHRRGDAERQVGYLGIRRARTAMLAKTDLPGEAMAPTDRGTSTNRHREP